MSATVIPFPASGQIPAGMLPLDVMLSAIPSLPRPILARLTARMIDRMDELDGDSDLEDGDEDRCAAGDDAIVGGPTGGWQPWHQQHLHLGSEDDAEGGGVNGEQLRSDQCGKEEKPYE